MMEPLRRQLWGYRAARVTPVRLKQALVDEVHRVETHYHQNLEPEEGELVRIVPRLIDRFQASTRRALERLSHAGFFAAAKELEQAQGHLRELERVLEIRRFHEEVTARCSEVHEGLASERLRRLRTGEMLKRLPEAGSDLLDQGDYLAARFIARSGDRFVRRLTAQSRDEEEKRLLRVRITALDVGDLETEVADILPRFLSEHRLYLATQIVGDLEVWLTREQEGSDLRSALQQLRRTKDRARQVTREIVQNFPLQPSDSPEEAPSNGQSDD